MTETRLPPAGWRDAPGLRRVLTALGDAGTTLAVGGAVRDTLAGHRVTDVDLATVLLPDDVIARLAAAGIKVVPTGLAHGTVTAVADHIPYEVTTLRRDVATDGRHATVAFTADWATDAARRDFTINALYADPLTGRVLDPVGGIADLAARRVCFIGDAAARIDEDHLRMMRFFRFHARFGAGAPDPATLAVIAGRAAKLRGLSRERIADELLKLLRVTDAVPALTAMAQSGILAQIIAGDGMAAAARVAALDAAESAAILPPVAERRLIALLPEDAGTADGVAAKLKLSKRLRKRIVAARQAIADHDPRAIAYRLGSEAALDRALLAGDAAATLAALDGWAVPALPIGGGALIARGVPAGPAVAATLRAIEAQWVADDFPQGAGFEAIVRGVVRAGG